MGEGKGERLARAAGEKEQATAVLQVKALHRDMQPESNKLPCVNSGYIVTSRDLLRYLDDQFPKRKSPPATTSFFD